MKSVSDVAVQIANMQDLTRSARSRVATTKEDATILVASKNNRVIGTAAVTHYQNSTGRGYMVHLDAKTKANAVPALETAARELLSPRKRKVVFLREIAA